MGEIRTKVTLTNAGDLQQQRSGASSTDRVRSVEVFAIVDTKSIRSAIPEYLIDQLGLGNRYSSHAGSNSMRQVNIAAPIRFEIFDRDTVDEALVLGDEGVVGATVLSKLDLFVDFYSDRLEPNPQHPGYAVTKVRRSIRSVAS